MATESFQTDLQLAEKLLYNECGFQLQHLVWNSESANYGACSFELNNKLIQKNKWISKRFFHYNKI